MMEPDAIGTGIAMAVGAALLIWLRNRKAGKILSAQKPEDAHVVINLPAEIEAQGRALVKSGHLIDAVKLIRAHSGAGLAQAKDLAETWR